MAHDPREQVNRIAAEMLAVLRTFPDALPNDYTDEEPDWTYTNALYHALERNIGMRTRQEHLEFCKQRAREYLERGDTTNAVTSMLSDLSQHPETEKSSQGALAMLGMHLLMSGAGAAEVRRFIEGFN